MSKMELIFIVLLAIVLPFVHPITNMELCQQQAIESKGIFGFLKFQLSKFPQFVKDNPVPSSISEDVKSFINQYPQNCAGSSNEFFFANVNVTFNKFDDFWSALKTDCVHGARTQGLEILLSVENFTAKGDFTSRGELLGNYEFTGKGKFEITLSIACTLYASAFPNGSWIGFDKGGFGDGFHCHPKMKTIAVEKSLEKSIFFQSHYAPVIAKFPGLVQNIHEKKGNKTSVAMKTKWAEWYMVSDLAEKFSADIAQAMGSYRRLALKYFDFVFKDKPIMDVVSYGFE